MRYAIRLPANDALEQAIEDLLTRPGGPPSYAPLVRYRSFHYQARLLRPERTAADCGRCLEGIRQIEQIKADPGYPAS